MGAPFFFECSGGNKSVESVPSAPPGVKYNICCVARFTSGAFAIAGRKGEHARGGGRGVWGRSGGGGRGSDGPNAINQWVSMMVHTRRRRVATTWGVSICGSHTLTTLWVRESSGKNSRKSPRRSETADWNRTIGSCHFRWQEVHFTYKSVDGT